MSLLTKRAKKCGTAEWNRNSSICSSVDLFSAELKKVFDQVLWQINYQVQCGEELKSLLL